MDTIAHEESHRLGAAEREKDVALIEVEIEGRPTSIIFAGYPRRMASGERDKFERACEGGWYALFLSTSVGSQVEDLLEMAMDRPPSTEVKMALRARVVSGAEYRAIRELEKTERPEGSLVN